MGFHFYWVPLFVFSHLSFKKIISLAVILLLFWLHELRKTTTSTPFFFPPLGVFLLPVLLPWQTWARDWALEPNSFHSVTADVRSSSAVGEPGVYRSAFRLRKLEGRLLHQHSDHTTASSSGQTEPLTNASVLRSHATVCLYAGPSQQVILLFKQCWKLRENGVKMHPSFTKLHKNLSLNS